MQGAQEAQGGGVADDRPRLGVPPRREQASCRPTPRHIFGGQGEQGGGEPRAHHLAGARLDQDRLDDLLVGHGVSFAVRSAVGKID